MARNSVPSLTLAAALAATVSGCATDPGSQIAQRDVYVGPNAFENCVADWGNESLCKQQLEQAEKNRLASAAATSGHASNIILINSGGYYGPAYTGHDRKTFFNGQVYRPAASRAISTASFSGGAPWGAKPIHFGAHRSPVSAVASSSTFSAARSVAPSTMGSVSRGGFGSAGHASAGG